MELHFFLHFMQFYCWEEFFYYHLYLFIENGNSEIFTLFNNFRSDFINGIVIIYKNLFQIIANI